MPEIANELNLLSWPDYISPGSLRQFFMEFGIKVRGETVPSAVEMMERMHKPPLPDVLCPPEYLVRDLSAENLLFELDNSLLPNLKNLYPQFRVGRAHDPHGAVSVIKDWGTTGFMYRTDLVNGRPQSWKDFWDMAEDYSGHITVLDSPGEVIGAALKKNGCSYNASDAQSLDLAQKDLLRLKTHLFSFETDYKPLLTSGQVSMALGWNGDAAALVAAGIPIQYVVPFEGSQIWEDDWAIARNALRPETAHDFLNFVLRPEVAAQEARHTRYATGNQAAFALLDENLRRDPATYPSKDLMDKLERGLPFDSVGAERRTNLWKEIRS